MELKKHTNKLIFSLFLGFLLVSYLTNFEPGLLIKDNFTKFTFGMLKVLPAAFILIGLFEVWIKKETIEKHFGRESGFKGFLWAIILASTTVGGTYVAFPVAYSLHQKGAKYSIVFTYISASALTRIPMTLFEASFLGVKFTLIRLITSLPLIILSSIWLGNFVEKRNYGLSLGDYDG